MEIGAGARELVGLTRAGGSTRRLHYDPLYPTPHQMAGAPPTWNALVMLLSAGSSAPRPHGPRRPPLPLRSESGSVSYGLQAEVHGLTTMIARANDHNCTG